MSSDVFLGSYGGVNAKVSDLPEGLFRQLWAHALTGKVGCAGNMIYVLMASLCISSGGIVNSGSDGGSVCWVQKPALLYRLDICRSEGYPC